MGVGFARGRAEVDQRAGQLAVNVRNLLTEVERFAEILGQASDAYLMTDLGYTQAEATLLKAAYTDLYLLARVYRGAVALPVVKDFRTNSVHLMGVV